MVNLRISKEEIHNALLGVSEETDEDAYAKIAWSVICEPGDGFAGLLVSALGAAGALEVELDQLKPQAIRGRILDQGFDVETLDSFGVFEKLHMVARERWRPRMSLERVRQAIYGIKKWDGFVITQNNNYWPSQINDLQVHTPFALWVRGSRESLAALDRSVAIVGSRGSTAYGEFATDAMVSALVPRDFSVVSGGAYGIDGVAHRSTLALQGNTVAVMAGGLDRLYPSGNSDMLRRISQTGAVVSELPVGTHPTRWRFLQRNRLIAALAQSTLVIEANWRSGALNTVSHSERLEREVFAVPGPITSPKSAGTNKLIADGRAQLILDGQDLLSRIGEHVEIDPRFTLRRLGPIDTRVLDSMTFDPQDISEICASAGLTRDEARLGISNLEMEGLVVRRGNTWSQTQAAV